MAVTVRRERRRGGMVCTRGQADHSRKLTGGATDGQCPNSPLVTDRLQAVTSTGLQVTPGMYVNTASNATLHGRSHKYSNLGATWQGHS